MEKPGLFWFSKPVSTTKDSPSLACKNADDMSSKFMVKLKEMETSSGKLVGNYSYTYMV